MTITGFSPAVPQPGSALTITGTVTNTTDDLLYGLSALFWRDPDGPITTESQLAAAARSPANDPLGKRVVSSEQTLTHPVDTGTLDPGATASFRVQTSFGSLGLGTTDGIYLIGVQIRGTLDGSGSAHALTLGRARLFVPIARAVPATKVHTTTVVVLSTRPSETQAASANQPALFADDHLGREVSSGGQLDRLLSAAERPGVSYAVDPSLIAELTAMRAGYRVTSGSGSVVGTARIAADGWLRRFAILQRTRDGFRTAYALLDLTTVTHANLATLLARSDSASRAVPSVASLPLLMVPADGMADEATLSTGAALQPKAWLLSAASTGSSDPLVRTSGGVPAASFTSASYDGGPGPSPSTTPVHLQMRVLADSLLRAMDAAPGTTVGQVRVITTPEQAESQLQVSAPWIVPTTLSALLAESPSAGPALGYPTSAAARELSADQVARVRQLSSGWDSYLNLLSPPAPADVQRAGAVATARAASAQWRDRASAQRVYLAGVSATIAPALSGSAVRLSATRILLTSSSGRFPVTVANSLPVPVRVRIAFTSAQSQRLAILPVDPVTVGAGERLQVQVPARASVNGSVGIVGRLYTLSGAPIGQPVALTVDATRLGSLGWLIAVGAGLVLVGTTAFRIRQVSRERRAAGPVAAPIPTGPAPIDPSPIDNVPTGTGS